VRPKKLERKLAMKGSMIIFGLVLLMIALTSPTAQEKGKYPAPRFPSYMKPPKSIDDVMPFARAAVPQPKLGLSRAKTQRPQRSEKNGEDRL
jgi:hypothetical protein